MTEQISHDLIDMGEHPFLALLAFGFALVVTFGCLIGFGAGIMVLYQIGKMVL